MRLGGFVICGDDGEGTLPRCLASLSSVCDDVVALDNGARGRSGAVATACGVRTVRRRWEGYGAARAAAVRELPGCDFVFFLDADEWLEPEAITAILEWKGSDPELPRYELARRDWAELDQQRFLYRVEHHVRLVRADAAAWEPAMIVHEALPEDGSVRLDAALEHHFAHDVDSMRVKCERYALLWAIRHHGVPRATKPAGLQRAAHLARELLLKGALFRGGMAAVRLARAVADHHARKYELLAALRRGAHADLVQAYEDGRLEELFARLP